MQLHVDHHYLYNQQHRLQQEISEEEEEAESALSADEVLSHAAAAADKKVSQNNLVYLKGKAVINGARPILVYWPLFVFLPTQKRGKYIALEFACQSTLWHNAQHSVDSSCI